MKWWFIVLILLCSIIGNSQTARIRVNYGSHIEINFNTFNKLNNGIIKTDASQVSIFFEDDNTQDWQLLVKAVDGYSDITPFFGGVGLPLNIIEIQAKLAAPVTVWTKQLLSTSYTEIATGDIPGNDGTTASVSYNIDINYEFNTNAATKVNFADYVNDTYYVELDFLLRRKP